MKRTDYILRLVISAVFAFGVAACSDDPTSAGAGQAIAISTNRSVTVQDAGNSFTVVAWASDATGTRIATPIAVTASSNLVTVDSAIYHPELAETRIFATANSVGVDNYLVLTAGGLTDSVTVNILNGPFPGTVATGTSKAGGLTLTFTNSSAIFDEDTDVEVNAGAVGGYVESITPTTLTYVLPYGQQPASLDYEITNAGVNDFNLSGTYNLTTAAPPADTLEPNNGLSTAKTITEGSLVGTVDTNSDVDDLFRFTPTADGTYHIVLEWHDDSIDIDSCVFTNTGGVVSCAGATGADPEDYTVDLTGGTPYIVLVEAFADNSVPTTYRLTITKQ